MALQIATLAVLFVAVLCLIAYEIRVTRTERKLALLQEEYDFDVAIPLDELREALERASMTWDWPSYPHANIEGLLDGSCMRFQGRTMNKAHAGVYAEMALKFMCDMYSAKSRRALSRIAAAVREADAKL